MENDSQPPPENQPSPAPMATPPPPPLSAPPVIKAQPSSKPARIGRGWKIFAIILLVLLVLSLFGNVGQFVEQVTTLGASHDRWAGPRLEELVIEDNDSNNKIAVVGVEGIISSQLADGSYDLVELIKEQLNRAAEDKHVRAVILKVDSPGGEVLASDDIYNAIVCFQEDTGKPVVAALGSLAASGGYYVSAASRWIVANELTITGSIGVIMHTWNYRGLMDKVGLRPEVYKSGKYKDMLSGERREDEISPEERAMVQALIDETYNKFKGAVAAGRTLANKQNGKAGVDLAANWENFADGRILSGTEARKLGFVDELGDLDTAVLRAEKLAGLQKDDSNLIEYRPRHELADLFRLFGKTDSRALKVDLGMDFPKLQAGHLYFLSPTFLH